MHPIILITRPAAAGVHLADEVRARWGEDIRIELSPLMRIAFLDHMPSLGRIRHLIFTSRNGVLAFTRLTDRRDIPCTAVGETTAQTAENAGLETKVSGGDAASLIADIRKHPGAGPYLHIRGAHVAADIADRLNRAGIETVEAVLYRQIPQPLSASARSVLRGDVPVILPVFSPRSARLFFDEWTQDVAPLSIAAISANAAAEVPQARIRRLEIAETPDAPGVLAAMQRLLDAAKPLEGRSPEQ